MSHHIRNTFVEFFSLSAAIAVVMLHATTSQAQAMSGFELLDATLRGVHSLHVVSTNAKIESKRATAEGRHIVAGRLRSISAQSNGLSANLYNRLVPQLTSTSTSARLQQSFGAYMRFDFANLMKTVQSLDDNFSPEYAGSILMMSSSHDEISASLAEAASLVIRSETGVLCSVSDQGTEEHPMAHVGVAPTTEHAAAIAMDKCQELHAGCKPARCVSIRIQIR